MKKKPNIIIVEGIDRVGKTTLVNKISEKFGYKILPSIQPISKVERTPRREIDIMLAQLSVFQILKNDYIIVDRFYLSEFVYGLYDRGYTSLEALVIGEKLKELNSLMVLVRPTDIKKSSEEHGSDLTEHSELFNHMFEISEFENKACCNYSTMEFVVNLVGRSIKNENCNW